MQIKIQSRDALEIPAPAEGGVEKEKKTMLQRNTWTEATTRKRLKMKHLARGHATHGGA